jgi:hypothetical protein
VAMELDRPWWSRPQQQQRKGERARRAKVSEGGQKRAHALQIEVAALAEKAGRVAMEVAWRACTVTTSAKHRTRGEHHGGQGGSRFEPATGRISQWA